MNTTLNRVAHKKLWRWFTIAENEIKMSELKQRLLIEELAKIGFDKAYYIPDSDKVKINPDDERLPFIDNENNIWYGTEHDKFVKSTIRPLVDKVTEIVSAWDNSKDAPLIGVKNIRLLAEHGNIMFGALAYNPNGDGLRFATWEYNSDHTAVENGFYSEDFNTAKENFALRSGLDASEVVLKWEKEAENKTTPDNQIETVAADTKEIVSTPNTDFIFHKDTTEKSTPFSDNPIIEQPEQSLYQQLIEKIDAEMSDYTDYVMQKDKDEIFNMATDIAMREEIVWGIKNNEYDYDNDSLEYLLSYGDLLTQAAGELKGKVLDGFSVNGEVEGVLTNILAERYVDNNKTLADYLPKNEKVLAENTEHHDNVLPDIKKPSILAQVEKNKEIVNGDKGNIDRNKKREESLE